ncbi:MAG: hypothetical protein RJQ01_03315 [Microcella sp.]|uniref:hypothetical protein n=1 Tax=Microcella sp. TaxID=1913979 RepID=UPI003314858D
MTALTANTLPTTARPLGRRTATIMLLQLTNPMTLIGWPLAILGFIYGLNVAIYALISSATGGASSVEVNGGVGFIWVYTLVMAVQSVNQTFPLALGFGATRRDYLLGTGVLFTLLSAGYAALIATLAIAERAVDYWGIGLRFFDTVPSFTWVDFFLGNLLILLLFASIGAATASVYVRWKATGMYVFWAALVIALVGLVFVITWTESWGAVGEFFAAAGVLGTLGWSLVISALGAIAAYLILRRATPTNT